MVYQEQNLTIKSNFFNLEAPPVDATAEGGKSPQKGDALLYTFLILVACMNSRQQTVSVIAKSLKLNADEQSKLNSANAAIKYMQIPAGKVGQATLQRVQDYNAQKTKDGQNIQNLLITSRQVGQDGMANANEAINFAEEAANQNAAVISCIKMIGNVTVKMNKRG